MIEYEKNFNRFQSLLTALESEIRHNVVYDIQAWWACHLLTRKLNQIEVKRIKSQYYFHIRRLVKMKHAVDHWDKWVTSLESLEIQFCDVLKELTEYRLYKSKKIQNIVTKFAHKILQKYKKHNTLSLLKVK